MISIWDIKGSLGRSWNICFLLVLKSKSHKIHPEHVDVNMLSVIGFYSYIFIHRTGILTN